MITPPAIYTDNEGQVSKDLLPPFRRLPKWLAWFVSILTPQQWLNDLAFTGYYGGSTAVAWGNGNTYNYGDQVKYVDYSVYESVNTSAFVSTIAPPADIYDAVLGTGNWVRVLDTFVGVGERVRYTGQKTMLEYILNYYFQVGVVATPWMGASHVNQIYISNGIRNIAFWLSNGAAGSLTSYMANNSVFQQYFMGNAYSLGGNFTIYVPVAVDAAITANQVAGVTAEDVIRSIADRYVQAGKLYDYQTY